MLFAGGEFYDTRRWMLSERAPFPDIRDHTYFLNGGQACLMVIAGYLRERGIRNILLSAYLCPSIPKTLKQCGLSFDFYRIDRDFSTDLTDLSCILSAGPTQQVVCFINYLGFLPVPATLDFLQ